MKSLLLILTLSLCLSSFGQRQTTWQRIDRPLAIIGYHIGTVALGAIGDGVFDNGNKQLGHLLQGAEVAALISGPFIFNIKRNEALPYLSTYVFMRFSFFDLGYNKSRGLPGLYNGDTTYGYDKFMNTIPPDGRAWMKTWSLVVGVSIPIKHL